MHTNINSIWRSNIIPNSFIFHFVFVSVCNFGSSYWFTIFSWQFMSITFHINVYNHITV